MTSSPFPEFRACTKKYCRPQDVYGALSGGVYTSGSAFPKGYLTLFVISGAAAHWCEPKGQCVRTLAFDSSSRTDDEHSSRLIHTLNSEHIQTRHTPRLWLRLSVFLITLSGLQVYNCGWVWVTECAAGRKNCTHRHTYSIFNFIHKCTFMAWQFVQT